MAETPWLFFSSATEGNDSSTSLNSFTFNIILTIINEKGISGYWFWMGLCLLLFSKPTK
jgi:hypothetical protein